MKINQPNYDILTDDPALEIVRNITDGNPLAILTPSDVPELLRNAQEQGYTVPDDLTPERFLIIYLDLMDDNLVAIIGRKTAEYMERDAAIRFYTEAVASVEGSEQSRYANVLSALKAGEQIVYLY